MDAASNYKSFLVALMASFGAAPFVLSDDAIPQSPCKDKQCQVATAPKSACADAPKSACADGACCEGQVCDAGKCEPGKCCVDSIAKDQSCCETTVSNGGIAAFVSDWLAKTPKFSAQVAIHFGTPTVQDRNLPMEVVVHDHADGRFAVGQVFSDLGVAGNFLLEKRPFDVTRQITGVNQSVTVLKDATPISKPMRFSERLPRIQLGDLVNDVIICGHRICTGNKCYDVKDEPVKGTACDKADAINADECGQEEPIQIVPMAPPAPPIAEVAQYNTDGSQTEASAILRNSGLGNVNISVPVTTVVDLLVAKTELSTRLEMTSQLMDERQAAMQQIQALANRNAALSTQLAVAEARNQMSESLTASVVEKAELAIKLAALEPKNGKLQSSNNAVQTIQEDLSNIRRQIALLRRSPVPFAQSYVGTQVHQPYVPTAQLPVSQMTKETEVTSAIESTESVPPTTSR